MLALVLEDQPSVRSKLNPNDLRSLKATFEGGFDLDPGFTTHTNSFCLKLMGIQKPLREVLSFDFLRVFETDERYRQLLNDFGRVLVTKESK